jgi:four helix bundle suffix protein
VAKASLNELQGDLEDYLVQKGSIPWSIRNSDHHAVLSIMLDEFDYTEDLLHDYWTYLLRQKKKFDPWLEDRDDISAANALIVLIQRATGLLGRQLTKLESAFIETGGIREKMTAARLEARAEPGAPMCPECGTAMKKRISTRGSFWGCGAYPSARACGRSRARRRRRHDFVTPGVMKSPRHGVKPGNHRERHVHHANEGRPVPCGVASTNSIMTTTGLTLAGTGQPGVSRRMSIPASGRGMSATGTSIRVLIPMA